MSKKSAQLARDAAEFGGYEISRAFSDCHGTEKEQTEGMNRRNLDFRSSYLLTREQAVKVMSKYCKSYNEFRPDLLKLLPDGCLIRIAREGSAGLYVETEQEIPKSTAEEMKVDEFDLYQTIGDRKVYRFWWD
jgi:hypothetical protein